MRLSTLVHFRPGPWPWADSTMTVAATTGPLLAFSCIYGRESGLAALCGGFAALYGLGEPLRRRAAIVAAAGAGMAAVMVACSVTHASPLAAGLVLALTAALATFLIDVTGAGQPGMIMFLVTGSVALSMPATTVELGSRAFVTGSGAAIALCLSLALAWALPSRPAGAASKLSRRSARHHAMWMAGATFATATVVVTAGVTHWQWAPISAAAVLQGTDTTTIFSRAVQRSVGTVVGVLISALLLMTDPTFTATVLFCSACLGASQLLFPRNYALGIICITPLAFLLPGIAQPVSDSGALLQRIWATAFGAMLGVLLWHFARRRASYDARLCRPHA